MLSICVLIQSNLIKRLKHVVSVFQNIHVYIALLFCLSTTFQKLKWLVTLQVDFVIGIGLFTYCSLEWIDFVIGIGFFIYCSLESISEDGISLTLISTCLFMNFEYIYHTPNEKKLGRNE